MPGTKAGHDDNEKQSSPIESQLMDSLNPEHPPVTVVPAERRPRIWKFWGTALWGLFVFAALFVGQIAVVAWFVLRREGPIDVAAADPCRWRWTYDFAVGDLGPAGCARSAVACDPFFAARLLPIISRCAGPRGRTF